jgi:hypothetical protein
MSAEASPGGLVSGRQLAQGLAEASPGGLVSGRQLAQGLAPAAVEALT